MVMMTTLCSCLCLSAHRHDHLDIMPLLLGLLLCTATACSGGNTHQSCGQEAGQMSCHPWISCYHAYPNDHSCAAACHVLHRLMLSTSGAQYTALHYSTVPMHICTNTLIKTTKSPPRLYQIPPSSTPFLLSFPSPSHLGTYPLPTLRRYLETKSTAYLLSLSQREREKSTEHTSSR